jgi:capsular exopolysaccharide synthesis family protein
MSQIFDALQRSEAERNGKDSATARVTDLLEIAERHAAVSRSRGEHPTLSNVQFKVDSAVTTEETKDDTRPVGEVELPASKSVLIPEEESADNLLQCETLSISASATGHLVSLPDSESPAGEAFHLLGVRLRHLRRQRPLKKILITSTIPQEGKSLVAANLACTLAMRTQQKVLLLEGDVRRPTQSKIFGIPNAPGICEWLTGQKSLLKSMYRLEVAGIWIFPAGSSTGNSLELLQSGVTPMMEQLSKWFDWVVIDSPPILPLADTSVWTSVADGTILVTRQGTTQKRQLQRGLEALGNHKLIGAILNSATGATNSDYYYRPTNRLPSDDAPV